MAGANGRRMIADQTVVQMGGRFSILARQRADHARLSLLMDRARATRAEGGVEHAGTLRALTRLVFTHAFAEESVLFPAARRVLPEGDPLTLHIESAHQEVDELVVRLDRSSARDPGHAVLMERTFAVLDEDVRSEEDELLPRLQELLSPRQLRVLGWQWELVRRVAPTRAHPTVSRRRPGQALSALPLTVLHRSRDQLQRVDERTRGGSAGCSPPPTADSPPRQEPWSGCRSCSAGNGRRPTTTDLLDGAARSHARRASTEPLRRAAAEVNDEFVIATDPEHQRRGITTRPMTGAADRGAAVIAVPRAV